MQPKFANLGTYLGIREVSKHQNSHKSKLEIWRFENLNNNHATQRDQNNKIDICNICVCVSKRVWLQINMLMILTRQHTQGLENLDGVFKKWILELYVSHLQNMLL